MPLFKIIYVTRSDAEAKVPFENWTTYETVFFADGKEAKAHCKRVEEAHARYETDWDTGERKLIRQSPYVFAIKAVPKDEDYTVREAERQKAGEYVQLPKEWDAHDTSFPRITEDKQSIAFYRDEGDARRDRLTEMKITRYIQRFLCTDTSTMFDMMEAQGLISGECELHFATTREDIRFVYENGPESCMSAEAERYYGSGVHPVEAYASPDLELAYMKRGDMIVSRALCNAHTKKWVRVYGDIERMVKLLDKQGYSEDPFCLGGMRLLKLFGQRADNEPRKDILMLPYLDGRCCQVKVTRDPEYIFIQEPELIYHASTEGYIQTDFVP